MRKFFILALVILAILFAAIGFRFAQENATSLMIQLLGWSSPELPTFLWLVAFLVFGFLLGYFAFIGKNLSLRMKLRQARSELKRRSTNQNRIVRSQSVTPSTEADTSAS